jgi:murein DD-endopeptidase MepM/ murein hydrolase activator NlpD
MRKLLPSLAVIAVAALGGVGGAAGGPPPTFVVVPSTQPMTPLASADTPNAPGLVMPSAPADPHHSAGLPFTVLHDIWVRAGATYGVPWQVLAAINKVESNFGRNMGPSSAGAVGWMQFMPDTWLRWGMDANGDGVADPWNADDAIFAAARYLAASGGRTDISRAIFSYNHAQWYVNEVLNLARLYGVGGVGVTFSLDRMQVRLNAAEKLVAEQNNVVVRATLLERQLAKRTQALYVRADQAKLLSDRLELQKRAFQMDARRAGAAQLVSAARQQLKTAEQSLSQARTSSMTSTFAPGAGTLLAAPSYQGGYVFPVGGGPGIVSVGHHHHDYPAADIAAPTGTPLYALTNASIVRAWHLPSGGCGIGLTLRATVDGREWTYCHMSYEEPTIQAGVLVSAGAPVGLVGATGDATGPHLHLQIDPPTSYPQVEPWFQSFAGTAFRWQDAPTPQVAQTGAVFQVAGPQSPAVPVVAATGDGSVIQFTITRP